MYQTSLMDNELCLSDSYEKFQWYKALNGTALEVNTSSNVLQKEKFQSLIKQLEKVSLKNEALQDKDVVDLTVAKYFFSKKNPEKSFQFKIERVDQKTGYFDEVFELVLQSFPLDLIHKIAKACSSKALPENPVDAISSYIHQQLQDSKVVVYVLIDKTVNIGKVIATVFISPHEKNKKILFFLCRKPNYSHLDLGEKLLNYVKENLPGEYILSTFSQTPLPKFYKRFGFKEDESLYKKYKHLFPDQVFMSGKLSD